MHELHQVTTTLTVTLPDTYGYVLIVAVVIALEVLLIGFAFPGKIRGEVFTEEYLKNNFGQQHKEATGQEIAKGGYPDSGCGIYSQKLSYKQWFDFNNAQRAHYNFLEMLSSTLVFLLIGGIYFPIPSAVIGLVTAISRVIYSIGYVNSGPKGRLVGALLNDLCLLGLLGLSLASAVMFTQGKAL